ncbi:MAG TPA: FAD-binding oxidoreductase [Acidimicrobiales bacterium]
MSSTARDIGQWEMATVLSTDPEASRAKVLRLRLPEPSNHLAGQHYVVRLTAPDGYTATRSFPVVSPPDRSTDIEIAVERIAANEVSMFLNKDVQAGDQLEVRGPIGGWFVWPGDTPALLLSGGRSALFPMIAMLRLARRTGASDLIRLVVCVGSPEGLYFSGELPGPETSIVYTNRAPDTAGRPPGRLKKHDVPIMPTGALAFICGSSSFTDRATELVTRTGIPVGQIRTDRFSSSGSH